MGRLNNKVIIVTGAGSGMGAATTAMFVDEGAHVIACDMNESGLKQWEGNPNIISLQVDLTQKAAIDKISEVVKHQCDGKLHGLCNIAGINDLGYPLLETDDERWDRVIDVDLKAPFRLIRAIVPILIENGGGSIVNVGSYAALRGNHGPSYTAAKTGLTGLTKSVAFGHAKDNIRCNIIQPGGTATNIGETSGGAYHEAQQVLSNILMATPVRFYNEPKEIAYLCTFLCSDESTWINGAEISIDGGMAVC
ncbi:MAG TPA: SDR family oxidoreductase [Erysipelothrix sp.]|nr:SDR family oxidoreductase [Erysipelothrix sp.]